MAHNKKITFDANKPIYFKQQKETQKEYNAFLTFMSSSEDLRGVAKRVGYTYSTLKNLASSNQWTKRKEQWVADILNSAQNKSMEKSIDKIEAINNGLIDAAEKIGKAIFDKFGDEEFMKTFNPFKKSYGEVRYRYENGVKVPFAETQSTIENFGEVTKALELMKNIAVYFGVKNGNIGAQLEVKISDDFSILGEPQAEKKEQDNERSD